MRMLRSHSAFGRFARTLVTTLLVCGTLGALTASCRKDEPAGAQSQGVQDVANAAGALAGKFAQMVGRFFADRVDNLQRLAYSGNPFASDEEFARDIEGARQILFQPWVVSLPVVGNVTLPAWQGIYFFAAFEAHITAQNVQALAEAVSRAPQIATVVGMAGGNALTNERIRQGLVSAFNRMNATDKASLLVAAASRRMEAIVFGGADRGESASGQGSYHWGFILAAEAGPGGIGHEFIFDESGAVTHANVVFLGVEAGEHGPGVGGFYGWEGSHRELGFYFEIPGSPLGMFAVLNPGSLPGPIKDFLEGSHASESHGAPADSTLAVMCEEADLRGCIRSGSGGGCINVKCTGGTFRCEFPRNAYRCLIGQLSGVTGEACLGPRAGNCTQTNSALTPAQRGILSSSSPQTTSPATSAAPSSSTTTSETPQAAAARLGCTDYLTSQGSWSGCVEFLRWRAQATGRSVNAGLDAGDLAKGVEGCTTAAGASQQRTCSLQMLACVSSKWATDNFACLASGGGHSCRNLCQ